MLRTGARIAGRLGARWYAVYVQIPSERPERINPKDREAITKNIELAESLGATVVRVTAERPSEGLIAFAQREGITHVIFGQSARTRWGDPDPRVHNRPLSQRGEGRRGAGRAVLDVLD